MFSDLSLAKRLEGAEGHACAEYAQTRSRLFPESGATCMEIGGVCAIYDGVDSPVTQTYGLGLSEEPTPALFEELENFFLVRGAPVLHEVSPLAGVPTLQMLCERGYTPVETSSVMYKPVERPTGETPNCIRVRVIAPEEASLWSQVSARGWAADHSELEAFLRDVGIISAARKHGACFIAELNGQTGATAMLCLHEGVALFAGASTVPEMRRRGLQSALVSARLHYACDHGCDLAMMVALPGSDSQRNGERRGFRIAYTRTKWQLQGRH